jgi:photosystem II stability/assembly factor-like uncharacterized protein
LDAVDPLLISLTNKYNGDQNESKTNLPLYGVNTGNPGLQHPGQHKYTAVGRHRFTFHPATSGGEFAGDGCQNLNVSHDSGTTWDSVTPNINIKDTFMTFQFVNATTGWALTGDASNHHSLYKTSDGGSTWNILVP